MRAYVLNRYGDAEGSALMDVAAPAPGPDDILVNVRAAGLNPVELIEQEKLKVIVGRTFPFEKMSEALAYVESGRAKGKVVVTMS